MAFTNERYLVKRIFAEQPLRFPACVALFGLVGLLEGAAVASLAPLLEFVQTNGNEAKVGSSITSAVISALHAVHLPYSLLTCLLATFVLFSASQAANYWQARFVARAVTRFEARMRMRLFEALIAADWSFFASQKISDLMTLLVHFTQRSREGYRNLVQLLGTIVVAIIYVGLAFYVSWPMTAIMAVGAAGILLLLQGRTARGRLIGDEMNTAEMDMWAEASENLSAAKVVKAYGLEEHSVENFTRPNSSFERLQYQLEMNQATLRYLYESIAVAAVLIGVFVAVSRFGISLPTLVVFLVLFYRLSPRVSAIQSLRTIVISFVPPLQAVDDAVARATAAVEHSGAGKVAATPALVRFDRVDFAYDPERTVLHGVELKIDRGRMTAIVGPSGSGKSTLVDLLLGLIRPGKGDVLVDGTSLGALSLAEWRARIGYVGQDVALFHDTVRNNIRDGFLEATDADIERAAELAFAREFVDELASGFETVVGDRGVRLSGGQRQRIALARALVRRPEMLVLDEATSALDSESEQRIQQAVARLAGDTTIVVVTHRLSTVRDADVIYFLEHGRVIESGSFQELVASHGRFAEMQSLQSRTPGGSAE